MDLSSLADIRKAVATLDDVPKLDSFVACAGVMMPPYNVTADGVESQFAVNYLSNFLLVKLLLPKIEAAEPSSSILIVASSAVRQGQVFFDDINFSVCPPSITITITILYLLLYVVKLMSYMYLSRMEKPTIL